MQQFLIKLWHFLKQFAIKFWRWLKSWFVRTPTPSPPQTPKVIEINDLEYENYLLKLLEKASQGNTWGQLEGWLIAKNVDTKRLAKWLKGYGNKWLAQPDLHQELAQRLLLLSKIGHGDLARVARQLGEGLLLVGETETEIELISCTCCKTRSEINYRANRKRSLK